MSWANVHWTIANGTVTNDRGASIDFTSDPNGAPVTITVTATDNQGCSNSATTTIAARTIPPPVIHNYPDALCPGDMGSAYVDPPDPNGTWMSWANVHWTITNGTITNDRGTSVDFTADGTGDVVLMATVTDSQSCGSSASVSVPVRASTTIEVHSFSPSVCANGSGSVQIDDAPPDNPWTSVRWTVENGWSDLLQGTNSLASLTPTVRGLPVVVHVFAANSTSCATGSVVIPTYALPQPAIQLVSGSCPNSATVTNASSYTAVYWGSNDVRSPALPTVNGYLGADAQRSHHHQRQRIRPNGCYTTNSVGYDVSGLPTPPSRSPTPGGVPARRSPCRFRTPVRA